MLSVFSLLQGIWCDTESNAFAEVKGEDSNKIHIFV